MVEKIKKNAVGDQQRFIDKVNIIIDFLRLVMKQAI